MLVGISQPYDAAISNWCWMPLKLRRDQRLAVWQQPPCCGPPPHRAASARTASSLNVPQAQCPGHLTREQLTAAIGREDISARTVISPKVLATVPSPAEQSLRAAADRHTDPPAPSPAYRRVQAPTLKRQHQHRHQAPPPVRHDVLPCPNVVPSQKCVHPEAACSQPFPCAPPDRGRLHQLPRARIHVHRQPRRYRPPRPQQQSRINHASTAPQPPRAPGVSPAIAIDQHVLERFKERPRHRRRPRDDNAGRRRPDRGRPTAARFSCSRMFRLAVGRGDFIPSYSTRASSLGTEKCGHEAAPETTPSISKEGLAAEWRAADRKRRNQRRMAGRGRSQSSCGALGLRCAFAFAPSVRLPPQPFGSPAFTAGLAF